MLSLILLLISSLLLVDYFYLLCLFVFGLLYVVCFLNFNYLVYVMYKFSFVCLTDLGYYFVVLLLCLFLLLFALGCFSFHLVFLLVLVCFVFIQFFVSVSLLYMLLYFEFSFVIIYLLVVFWGFNPERLESLSYFLVYSVCGSFPLFAFVTVLVYYIGSSFSFDCIFQLFLCSSLFYPFDYSWFFSLYAFVVVFGFFFKFPVWGLHSWLPKAHVEAPYYGSVLLAGLMVKLGLYGIFYFYSYFLLFDLSLSFVCCLFVYMCFSLLFSKLSTVRQYDLKSYIAYSSIVHMGLVSLSFWSGSVLSVFGSLFLAVSHGFVSSLLFVGVSFFYSSSGTRILYLNRGYLYLYSLFVFFWFICLISNSSIPFSLGFFSELMLFYSSVQFSLVSSFFCCFNLFFCGLYCLYLYLITSHGCIFSGLGFGYLNSFLVCFVFALLLLFNSFFCLFLMVLC